MGRRAEDPYYNSSSSRTIRSGSKNMPRRDRSITRNKRDQSVPRKPKYGARQSRREEKEGQDYLTNTVVAFEEFGEAQEVLKLYEFKDKIRNADELKRNVVIQVEASSVSMTDTLIREGLWSSPVDTPYKTGCDLVGRVTNIGSKVDQFIQVGDMVCALGLSIGGNAKYAILPSSRVFPCPEDIHPTVAVCLVRNYMAAYQCLHRAGRTKIKAGDHVLVLGGAGAFGQACIQLAIAAGADEVYATGRSDRSKIIIESLGAQSLGRHPSEWLPEVKGSMDIVIDSVCSDRFRSSHRALNTRGKLVCVGATSVLLGGKGKRRGSGVPISVKFDMEKAASLLPNTSVYDVFSYFETKRDYFRKDLLRLFHLCRNHAISPKIAYCIPLNEVANAHDDIQMGDVTDGTIVCLPFGPDERNMRVTKCREDDEAIVTEYSDGVKLRVSTVAEALETSVGKVMRDGSFKVQRVVAPPVKANMKSFDTRDEATSEEEDFDSTSNHRRDRRKFTRELDDDDDDDNVETETETENDESLQYKRKPKQSNSKRRSSLGFNEVSSLSSYQTDQSEATSDDGLKDMTHSVDTETVEDNTFGTNDQSVTTDDDDSIDQRRGSNKFMDDGDSFDDSYGENNRRPPKHSKTRGSGGNRGYGNNRFEEDRNGRRGRDNHVQNRGRNEVKNAPMRGRSSSRTRIEPTGRSSSRTRIEPTGRSSSRTRIEARGRSSSRTRTEARGRSSSRGRTEARGRSSSRGRTEARGRSSSRGRTEARGRSSSRGRTEPRGRSSSRGRTAPRGRSSSRGRAESRQRSQSRGRATNEPRARSRSRSKSRTRRRSLSISRLVRGGGNEGEGKGLFAKIRESGRNLAETKEKIRSNLKNNRNNGRRSSSRGPTPREHHKHLSRQRQRENERRDMMYMEHDVEESSLFQEEAVRSMVMLKGEDELADEQSEVSWDGTAREQRRMRREMNGNDGNNRPSRSSRSMSRSHPPPMRPSSRGRAPQPSAMRNPRPRSSSRRRY